LLFSRIQGSKENKESSMNSKGNGSKPKKEREPGLMIGTGVALGAGVGSALGVAFGNIAIGIGVGVAIGAALGAAFEQQRQKSADSDDQE
jgi:hypothetical protein